MYILLHYVHDVVFFFPLLLHVPLLSVNNTKCVFNLTYSYGDFLNPTRVNLIYSYVANLCSYASAILPCKFVAT